MWYRLEPASLGMALLIVLSVVSFDLFSKLVIIDLVMQPPRSIPVTSFLSLELGFNSGSFFGLYSEFFMRTSKLVLAADVAWHLILRIPPQ